MTARPTLTVLAVLTVVGTTSGFERDDWQTAPSNLSTFSDSALDELSAGRFWHAARALRAEGAADGSPADVLMLARAEAGWENWPAVLALLDGDGALARADGGRGLYLLGRALEHSERWAEAAAQYGAYIEQAEGDPVERVAALARRARSAWANGDSELTMTALSELGGAPAVRSWAAAEFTLAATAAGDADAGRSLLVHVVEPSASDLLWRAGADALLNSGDSAAAVSALRELREEVGEGRRAATSVDLGRLLIAVGDTAAGRSLLLESVGNATGSARSRAAAALVELGGHDFERTLEFARILDGAGDGARALKAYDRAVSLAQQEGVEFPESSRLERARLMATVEQRRDDALAEFRTIRETTQSERIREESGYLGEDARTTGYDHAGEHASPMAVGRVSPKWCGGRGGVGARFERRGAWRPR